MSCNQALHLHTVWRLFSTTGHNIVFSIDDCRNVVVEFTCRSRQPFFASVSIPRRTLLYTLCPPCIQAPAPPPPPPPRPLPLPAVPSPHYRRTCSSSSVQLQFIPLDSGMVLLSSPTPKANLPYSALCRSSSTSSLLDFFLASISRWTPPREFCSLNFNSSSSSPSTPHQYFAEKLVLNLQSYRC